MLFPLPIDSQLLIDDENHEINDLEWIKSHDQELIVYHVAKGLLKFSRVSNKQNVYHDVTLISR